MRTGGDFANLPMLQKTASRPEMQRMSRNEKKERGWKVGKQWKQKLDPLPCNVKVFCFQVPEPNQCRGRLAEAVLLFLVNLTRPIDQRHQVGTLAVRIITMLMLKKDD